MVLGGMGHFDMGAVPDSLAIARNLGAVDVKLQGVERDGARVFGNVEINDNGAVKGQFVKVGLESDVIVARNDIGGKQLAVVGAAGSSSTASLVDAGLSSAHLVQVPSVGAMTKLKIPPAVGVGSKTWSDAGRDTRGSCEERSRRRSKKKPRRKWNCGCESFMGNTEKRPCC
jgi:hypothetical protein